MPMERFVNGIRFEGKVVDDCFVIRTWECNGVMERSAVPYVEWREVFDHGFKPDGFTFTDWSTATPEQFAEDAAERKERSLRKSAARAKTQCRRAIITEGFDELMTLTYRAAQLDRELCKKHFKEWVRRMKRALGEFRYCASFERQQSGSMHVHLATHRLPQSVQFRGVKVKTWELGTKVWRSIVGDDNGLCFVGGRNRFGAPRANRMSLARMAAYVAKYILKDYQDVPAGVNRYSRSVGAPVPDPYTMVVGCTYADLIGLVYEYLPGDTTIALRPSRFKDRLWFCKESVTTRSTVS